jgi:riboflavin kinase/FMN adenylyltransferase
MRFMARAVYASVAAAGSRRRRARGGSYNPRAFGTLNPMKILRGLARSGDRVPVALAIGNFDGVHRGHQALLAQLVGTARRHGLRPAVMTFEPHPRELFSPASAPPRVANIRDKIEALAAAGVERVFIQHFNRRFAALSPERFIDDVLVGGLEARCLLVGDDFRFGARRAGDVDLLRARAAAHGYVVEQLATVQEHGVRVSSSEVREALAAGDLAHAATLLGRPYAISGRVLHGRKLGREIGFPTLNLRLAHRRPAARGIFAVKVHGIGGHPRPGVASIGLRPTVEDSGRWLLEVHLFDFAQQVYGRLVQVELVHKLREEAKYESLQALSSAIRNDAAAARALLAHVDPVA